MDALPCLCLCLSCYTANGANPRKIIYCRLHIVTTYPTPLQLATRSHFSQRIQTEGFECFDIFCTQQTRLSQKWSSFVIVEVPAPDTFQPSRESFEQIKLIKNAEAKSRSQVSQECGRAKLWLEVMQCHAILWKCRNFQTVFNTFEVTGHDHGTLEVRLLFRITLDPRAKRNAENCELCPAKVEKKTGGELSAQDTKHQSQHSHSTVTACRSTWAEAKCSR